MIHMKVRLLLKPRLSVFSALVLHHTVFLLTHSGGGQSHVIGTSQPIVAKVGDDITLPCHLKTAMDATDLTVEWARPDLEPRFVYLRRDGVELQPEEHPLYMGRTSLSTNKLKCGDISLKLSQLKLSDAGTYKCLVPKSGTESVVALTVGSVSSPDIKISKVSNGVSLQCESGGWYPEPEVSWLDGEGNLLSAGPTETTRSPDDLYTVSSRVTVEKRPSNRFTCRVQQKDTNQTRETTIHLPDDFFMAQSNSAVRITICLAVYFMSVMAFFVLWKRGQHQIKTPSRSTEQQHLMDGDTMIQLEMKEENLSEELQKNEDDLKHVQQVNMILMTQKKELENQRQTLTSLEDKDKTQIKENNKKLKKLPKTEKSKKMEKRVKTREDLDRRSKEHDELLCNTKKLQETADQMITIMKERKEKLEKDKEKINQHLKETAREREETQKKLQLEQQEREEDQNNPSSNQDDE